jgi:formylglycine-generating enzyme required for sulfatase activity
MAARGGLAEKKYPWGDQQPICQKETQNGARFDDDQDCNNRGTAAVMTYTPNGYGLYDTAGNVWEWVNDRYWGYYYYISPEDNPPGPAIGLSRVLRGGGWFTDAYHARVSYRNSDRPSYSFNVVGFRCADTPE